MPRKITKSKQPESEVEEVDSEMEGMESEEEAGPFEDERRMHGHGVPESEEEGDEEEKGESDGDGDDKEGEESDEDEDGEESDGDGAGDGASKAKKHRGFEEFFDDFMSKCAEMTKRMDEASKKSEENTAKNAEVLVRIEKIYKSIKDTKKEVVKGIEKMEKGIETMEKMVEKEDGKRKKLREEYASIIWGAHADAKEKKEEKKAKNTMHTYLSSSDLGTLSRMSFPPLLNSALTRAPPPPLSPPTLLQGDGAPAPAPETEKVPKTPFNAFDTPCSGNPYRDISTIIATRYDSKYLLGGYDSGDCVREYSTHYALLEPIELKIGEMLFSFPSVTHASYAMTTTTPQLFDVNGPLGQVESLFKLAYGKDLVKKDGKDPVASKIKYYMDPGMNLIGAAIVKIEADRQSLIKKDTKYALTYELDTNCIIRYIPPDSKELSDYHKNEEKMMYQLNYIKFWKNARLLEMLLATGNAYIVDFRRFLTRSKVGAKWEGCIKVVGNKTLMLGENKMGEAIMKARSKLREATLKAMETSADGGAPASKKAKDSSSKNPREEVAIAAEARAAKAKAEEAEKAKAKAAAAAEDAEEESDTSVQFVPTKPSNKRKVPASQASTSASAEAMAVDAHPPAVPVTRGKAKKVPPAKDAPVPKDPAPKEAPTKEASNKRGKRKQRDEEDEDDEEE